MAKSFFDIISEDKFWTMSVNVAGNSSSELNSYDDSDKPFMRMFYGASIKDRFSFSDVVEVLSVGECYDEGNYHFRTISKLRDGRFVYTRAYNNEKIKSWIGNTSVAWTLKNLLTKAITHPEVIQKVNAERLLK